MYHCTTYMCIYVVYRYIYHLECDTIRSEKKWDKKWDKCVRKVCFVDDKKAWSTLTCEACVERHVMRKQ